MRTPPATWLLAGLLTSQGALADFVGRPVGEVLDTLRNEGLTFIYSTQRVPADLTVLHEPSARTGLALAREILAAHALTLSPAAAQVYIVVAAPPAVAKPVATPSPIAPIGEVIVQSSRYALVTQAPTRPNVMTQQQVNDLPLLADETLRAANHLPGTATNGFSSLGSVRGGDPNETAIVLDGLRLYEPFHLKDFLSPVSLLDPRLIEGIEVHSGGFPVTHGDRMGAVMTASTVRPEQPQYYEVSLNLFHTSALTAQRFADDRGQVLLSGRRGNAGDLARLSESDFGRPHYADGFARLDYQFTEATSGTLHSLVAEDTITALKSRAEQRARAKYRSVYAWGTLAHDWSAEASTRLIASYTDLTDERRGVMDEPLRQGTVRDSRLFHVLGLKLDNELTRDSAHYRWGLEARRAWGRYQYALDMAVDIDHPFALDQDASLMRVVSVAPESHELSGYFDTRIELGTRWSVQGGLRIDHYRYLHAAAEDQRDVLTSPRLAALYQLNERTQLRASWGRYFQVQGVNELQVEDGMAHFHAPQRADHFILSLERQLDAGLQLRVELYDKRYAQLHPRFENLFNSRVLFPEAEFDRVRIDPLSARAQGAEVSLNLHQQGDFSGWLSYSWSRVEDRMPAGHVPRSWDQRHAVNLGVLWSRGPWTATMTHAFHSGWPMTTMTGDLSDWQTGTGALQRNADRLRIYASLDLRLTRAFTLTRGTLDVFVEVTNALARTNPCCVEYTVDTNEDGSYRYQRQIEPWLPRVPSLGALWRY